MTNWSSTKRKNRPRGYCLTCNYDNVKRRRTALKQTLVAEAGGQCMRCGYNTCARALHFHHVDPSQKKFSLSLQTCKAIDKLRTEAAKCVLLCGNCHAELEDGLFVLASVSPLSDKESKG